MNLTKIITDEATYWFKALPLWARVVAAGYYFDGESALRVLGKIAARKYRLSWLRQSLRNASQRG